MLFTWPQALAFLSPQACPGLVAFSLLFFFVPAPHFALSLGLGLGFHNRCPFFQGDRDFQSAQMSPLCLEAHVFLKQSIFPHLHLYDSLLSSLLSLELRRPSGSYLSDPQAMIPNLGVSCTVVLNVGPANSSPPTRKSKNWVSVKAKTQNSSSDMWGGIYPPATGYQD